MREGERRRHDERPWSDRPARPPGPSAEGLEPSHLLAIFDSDLNSGEAGKEQLLV